MFSFTVRDMDACASAVAVVKAVKLVDETASVFVSLADHGVRIRDGSAGASELSDAIADAGFTPELVPTGLTSEGFPKPPGKIPFDGPDHDFTVGPAL